MHAYDGKLHKTDIYLPISTENNEKTMQLKLIRTIIRVRVF